MEFRKQDLLHEIDVVWLSSLESSKLYASCMQCNANFESVIVLYFFQYFKNMKQIFYEAKIYDEAKIKKWCIMMQNC